MLYIDTETYSALDIRKVGGDRYTRNCELLLVAWALDDGEVHCWDATAEPPPPRLTAALVDPTVQLCAFNVPFDRAVLEHAGYLETDPHRWVDTASLARSLGIPGKLEIAAELVLGEDDRKAAAEGKRLIQLFCKPRPKNHKLRRATRTTHPEEWQRFIDYCRQDVRATRALWQRLPLWNYNLLREQELLDWRINARGLPVDLELTERAIALCDAEVARLDHVVENVTGGALAGTGSRDKVLAWLEHQGVRLPDYQKATVAAALREELPPGPRAVLECRQQQGRSSTAKYSALAAAAVDGRLRGAFMFLGAERTGRWAGVRFQPHNLPRPEIDDTDVGADAIETGMVPLLYDDPMAVAASCIRSVIAAGLDRQLVVADFSNIEGRVLAWVAGEAWKLEAFRAFDRREGPDLYRLAYARSFRIDVDDVDKDQRQVGKVMELACGYQGWVGAFQTMAVGYGVEVPDDRAAELAGAWRDAHPKVCSLWYAAEDAALRAVEAGGTGYRAGPLQFAVRDRWLLMRLPSGRYLAYLDPEIGINKRGKEAISYTGMDSRTKQVGRIDTYGGKLIENAVQAIARDLLAEALDRAERDGWHVVGHVHDEIIAEEPTGDRDHRELEVLMSEVPSWAKGLPIAADGYTSRRFKK
jgi:DNA polymerase